MNYSKGILFKKVSLILLLLLIIVGCGDEHQGSTNTVLEPDVSIIAQSTTSASETVAPIDSSEETGTNSTGNLEIPTPIGEREQEQVLWLFETNNQCLLPCFWGIIPGETAWTDAEEFLKKFDGSIYRSSNDSETTYYEVDIDLPRDIFAEDRSIIGILVEDDKVQIVDTRISIGDTPDPYLSNYRLHEFLSTYGQPTEVWVSSSPQPFENNELPFSVILFYGDLGVMVLYGDNASLEGENVIGCPQKQPAKALSVWSPNNPLSFNEAKNGYAAFSGDFLPLGEVSPLNIEDFYNLFKNPENTNCITTPAEVWRFN